MSKLDDILKECSMGNVNSQADRIAIAKQQLKDLMLELVGGNSGYTMEHKGRTITLEPNRVDAQNDLREVIRQKIEAL